MTTQILVRLPPLLLCALDAASAAETPRTSRPEMLRQILGDWLATQAELGARTRVTIASTGHVWAWLAHLFVSISCT
jgi:hypothetical protein